MNIFHAELHRKVYEKIQEVAFPVSSNSTILSVGGVEWFVKRRWFPNEEDLLQFVFLQPDTVFKCSCAKVLRWINGAPWNGYEGPPASATVNKWPTDLRWLTRLKPNSHYRRKAPLQSLCGVMQSSCTDSETSSFRSSLYSDKTQVTNVDLLSNRWIYSLVPIKMIKDSHLTELRTGSVDCTQEK